MCLAFLLAVCIGHPSSFGDTPLLMLHECCKSKVGESHEGSSSSCGPLSSNCHTPLFVILFLLLLRLFDWQAERITLAIIALVPHERRKRQRRHIMLPGSFRSDLQPQS